MILDSIEHLALYQSVIPEAKKIAEAFKQQAPNLVPFEVREKVYNTKSDHQRRYEVHSRTIDLMLALDGAEVIQICSSDKLTPAETLSNGADGRKMDGAIQGTPVLLEKGMFCAIFPGEAHMVGGKVEYQDSSISKWVVKVLADKVFCSGD